VQRCSTRQDINVVTPAMVLPLLALLLLCSSALAAPVPDEPYRVLVLHSFRNILPANTDWYNGIVRGFTSVPDVRVEIDIEVPDLSHFGEENENAYFSKLLDIYRLKYRDHPPQLIIPTYTPALQFLLDHGEEVFPGIPIVFCGADSQFVATRPLPPHITGITSRRDFTGTLTLISQVQPDTQRIAVIVGSSAIDRQFEQDTRRAFQPFGGRFEFIWLQGLPLDELTEAVKNLPGHTVILYAIQLEDRAGKSYVPVSTLQKLSPAAKAPIYGLWDTLLGHGIIGGRLITLENDGFLAAQMGLRILRGEAPAALPVVSRDANAAIFDGRQLKRWHIDENRLPAGSQIRYRQLSLWEEHSNAIITAGIIISLQGFLIVALWLNRARLHRAQTALQNEYEQRRQAESDALTLRSRLARFSKQSALGALATGIAHEINQSLIAIQNYAQAAKRRVQSTADQKPKLNELLEKIEQQTGRAGTIIQRIRNLLNTDAAELLPVPLHALLNEVLEAMGPEIESQGCRIDYRPATALPVVLADVLQIQLVLVNLLHNAVHSMESREDRADKVITLDIRQLNDREVQVSVADRGPGVPAAIVEAIFEPLYSTKPQSMGMGLAICRTILAAHGGRIGYTPNPAGGAVFQFTLQRAAA
jgi:signal transduction histidine kinase